MGGMLAGIFFVRYAMHWNLHWRTSIAEAAIHRGGSLGQFCELRPLGSGEIGCRNGLPATNSEP
jgi:hypothetical protein